MRPKLHHITVNGRPMCEACMDIRHAARGCEYKSGAEAGREIAKLRAKFPTERFKAVAGGCPVYSAEYRGVAVTP